MKNFYLRTSLLIVAFSCLLIACSSDSNDDKKVKIEFKVNELTVERGSNTALQIIISPSKPANETITWSSDNNEIATVDKDGVVMAVSLGVANITVELMGSSAICKVTVVGKSVKGVSLDHTDITLTVEENQILIATIDPEDAENQTLTWSSSDEAVATVDEAGIVTAVSLGVANITVELMGSSAICKVTVIGKSVKGVSLDHTEIILIPEETKILTATIDPVDAEDQTLTWGSSDETVATVDEAGVVTAISVGTAIIVVTISDVQAECKVTVTASTPKIGDYFYSDGTWSNGGLISIDEHGLNPVWAEIKPAPLASKTVIGIIFQTSTSRIAEGDKEMGHTNGYVMSTRTAHGDSKETTYWSTDFNFSCLKAAKLARTWYNNVNGYVESQTVKNNYPSNLATMMPAFDLVLNKFPVTAPASTSGWFLPSTGQMWDMLANLCGGEVATHMQVWQTLGSNATYYCSEKASYDALARFNSVMEKVAEDQKDELGVIDRFHNYGSMWTSTPYDSESACMMNLGQDGLIECMTEWYDGDCVARPILAF